MDHLDNQLKETAQNLKTVEKEVNAVEHRILNLMTWLYVAAPILLTLMFISAVLLKSMSFFGLLGAVLVMMMMGIGLCVQPLRHAKHEKEDERDDLEAAYRYYKLKSQIFAALARNPDDAPPTFRQTRRKRHSRRIENLLDDAKKDRDTGLISQAQYDELVRTILFEG